MRITKDYSTQLKDDLLSEIEARKSEGSPNFDGVSLGAKKEELVAAIELDDEHEASKPSATPEARSAGKAVEIPKVTVSDRAEVICPNPPSDEDFTSLATRVSDGLKYAVSVHPPDTYNKTHTAKNSANFWQGTDAEFRAQFDKA